MKVTTVLATAGVVAAQMAETTVLDSGMEAVNVAAGAFNGLSTGNWGFGGAQVINGGLTSGMTTLAGNWGGLGMSGGLVNGGLVNGGLVNGGLVNGGLVNSGLGMYGGGLLNGGWGTSLGYGAGLGMYGGGVVNGVGMYGAPVVGGYGGVGYGYGRGYGVRGPRYGGGFGYGYGGYPRRRRPMGPPQRGAYPGYPGYYPGYPAGGGGAPGAYCDNQRSCPTGGSCDTSIFRCRADSN